jgi:hypothetical protein
MDRSTSCSPRRRAPWTLRLTRSHRPADDRSRHAGVMEYFVELDGHEDYLPTLLRSSLLRSPVLAG